MLMTGQENQSSCLLLVVRKFVIIHKSSYLLPRDGSQLNLFLIKNRATLTCIRKLIMLDCALDVAFQRGSSLSPLINLSLFQRNILDKCTVMLACITIQCMDMFLDLCLGPLQRTVRDIINAYEFQAC